MVKDKLNFRDSIKHPHGAAATEEAVGITQMCTSNIRRGKLIDERNTRVIGLMKWSLDDVIVQEIWPESALVPSTSESYEGKLPESFLVPVITEGVPDAAIAALIQKKCPRRTTVLFVTPVDFGASQERFALVRSTSHGARCQFQRQQTQRITEGVVCFGKAVDLAQRSDVAFPLELHHLPYLRYSIMLRGMKGALADVLPRLERLQENGFLNYTHLARHGVGLFRAFESGRYLLHRDYVAFLRSYILGLTERSPLLFKELSPLLEIMEDTKATRKSWATVKSGVEYALKKDDPVVRQAQTGLYYPHHALLRDFLERASDLFPGSHDSAQVIRESIPRLILQEKLRSVADVHFNALASLRWEMYGNKVAVGDLVILDDKETPIDVFEAPADHLNGTMTSMHHLEWLSVFGKEQLITSKNNIRMVQNIEEARQFTIEHVVLPVLGHGVEHLVLPGNRIKEAYERLAAELQIEGLPQMKIAPPATYRRLVVQPKDLAYCVFDDERGWCWESDNNAPIRAQLYRDLDGIIRQPSPFFMRNGKNMIARSGIRGVEARKHFLKPARRSGMTCVLQMSLPRGSAVTSALREVFQIATLDPGAIFRLLQ